MWKVRDIYLHRRPRKGKAIFGMHQYREYLLIRLQQTFNFPISTSYPPYVYASNKSHIDEH